QAMEALSQLDRFGTVWPSPPVWWIALYYVLLGIIVLSLQAKRDYAGLPLREEEWKRRKAGWNSAAAGAVLCFAVLLMYGYAPDRWSDKGIVSFLDVGQGDAILVTTPEQRH